MAYDELTAKLVKQIARLTAEIERLRAALEEIVRHCDKRGMHRWPICVKARAALEKK